MLCLGVALIFVEFYEVMDNFTADHFFYMCIVQAGKTKNIVKTE